MVHLSLPALYWHWGFSASCFLKIHPSSTEPQLSPLLSLKLLPAPPFSLWSCSQSLLRPLWVSSDRWITWDPSAALKALCLHSLCQKNRLMDLSVYKHWNNTQTFNSHSTTELSVSWGAKALQEEQYDTHVTANYCNITNKRYKDKKFLANP